MILAIILGSLLYLAIGYAITVASVKAGNIDNVIEFWAVMLLWLPSLVMTAMSAIIKGLLYTPKRLADWHIDNLYNTPKKPTTSKVKAPPRKP